MGRMARQSENADEQLRFGPFLAAEETANAKAERRDQRQGDGLGLS